MIRSASTRPRSPGRIAIDLRHMTADGAAYSIMVGIGETYLPAFALAAGLGELFAGIVAVLPMVSGALLGLAAPRAVAWLGSNRRWVVGCAVLQALSFVPLVAAALSGAVSHALLFGAAVAYWTFGLATGPAWNTWASSVVPASVRARYFGRRTRVLQFSVLSGLLLGGFVLELEVAGRLEVFALLFGAAGLARLVSAGFLSAMSEPARQRAPARRVSMGEMLRRVRSAHDGRFLLYLVVVHVSVQIAAPFFTPYMLSELDLSYGTYVALIASSYVAKIVASPWIGECIRRFGAARILWIAGFSLVPVPLFWLITTNPLWLAVFQLLSGMAWAAYDLSTFLIVFDTIPSEERTSVLTLYNFASTAAMAAGSLIGSWCLHAIGLGPAAYFAIFALSGAARALTLLFLRGAARPGVAPAHLPFAARSVAVRPSAGSIDRPVLSAAPGELEGPDELAGPGEAGQAARALEV